MTDTVSNPQSAAAVAPPDVSDVWRRWEPRFIAAGADFNIVSRLKRTITTWSEWRRAWSAEADRLDELAQGASDEDRALTAGELWSQASLRHHFGGMYFISDMEQFEFAHERSVELYRKAAPLLQPPARRITGIADGHAFVGYLQAPATPTTPPVAILFNGFEGTKEEGQQRVAELHARGLATLCWDGPGPGRGEAWAHSPMTGNYGPATAAMIDALERIPEVDPPGSVSSGPIGAGFSR